MLKLTISCYKVNLNDSRVYTFRCLRMNVWHNVMAWDSRRNIMCHIVSFPKLATITHYKFVCLYTISTPQCTYASIYVTSKIIHFSSSWFIPDQCLLLC